MERNTSSDNDTDLDLDIEDYGSPQSDEERPSAFQAEAKANAQGGQDKIGSNESQGAFSGGSTGVRQGNTEGEEFGEFEDTGQGVDLTETMANPNVRPELAAEAEEGESHRGIPPQFGAS